MVFTRTCIKVSGELILRGLYCRLDSGVAPANQTKKRAKTKSSWISPIFVNSGVFPWENKHDSHWTFVPECPCEEFMNWPFFGLVCRGLYCRLHYERLAAQEFQTSCGLTTSVHPRRQVCRRMSHWQRHRSASSLAWLAWMRWCVWRRSQGHAGKGTRTKKRHDNLQHVTT